MKELDYIYYNATVYGLLPGQDGPTGDAVAVRDGRVVAVGSLSEIRELAGAARAEAVDLKGATLLPGLNDAHTHFLWWAHSRREINLVGVASLDEIVEKVRQRAEVTPSGKWLTGLGWDKNLWGNDFPTREALDRAAPAHPVALHSKDGHLLWVNSRALERCGLLTTEVSDVPGGEVVQDAEGYPTGIFKEMARALVDPFIEEPDAAADLAALQEALPIAHRVGLTGVHSIEDSAGLSAWQRLRESGGLPFRVTVLPYHQAAPALIGLGLRQGFGDEFLKLGQIKFFLDGTLGSQTAAMFEPFLEGLAEGANHDHCHPENRGILRMAEEEFLEQARHCLSNGFGIAVHVIGDRAARLGLDVIERLQAELPPGSRSPLARNRLEHVQLVKAGDLPRLARNGIIASVQPTHATTDRDTAERYWGLPRLQESGRGYAYKSLLVSGAPLALGSDVPIEPIDPLPGIFAAVARRRPGDERPAWLPSERLSVAEAVRGFTQGASYAVGDESWRGQIAPGFAADFTVLAQDIFALPENEILSTPVVATIVAGQPVYSTLG